MLCIFLFLHVFDNLGVIFLKEVIISDVLSGHHAVSLGCSFRSHRTPCVRASEGHKTLHILCIWTVELGRSVKVKIIDGFFWVEEDF